jgi:hypothetical protein
MGQSPGWRFRLNDDVQWVSFEEAARSIRVPPETIREWWAAGRIDAGFRGDLRVVRLDHVREVASGGPRAAARQASTLQQLLRTAASNPDRLHVTGLQEQVRARYQLGKRGASLTTTPDLVDGGWSG